MIPRYFTDYAEAAEAAREQAVEDYYTKQEEEDPMDEADRRYDEMARQDAIDAMIDQALGK